MIRSALIIKQTTNMRSVTFMGPRATDVCSLPNPVASTAMIYWIGHLLSPP